MSILRRAGISTCCTQHVFDQVVTGRLVGPPIDAVAFEHAYDLILPVSDMMTAQLHALGVPHDKLLRVRNAGGIVVAEDRIGRALAERRHRSGPLRCIFLGRLDRQKGIERLSALIETCRGQGQALEWRIVGKAVVGEMRRDGEIAGIPIEPPVFDSSAVADCLAWADVVVMPSLYEGLPLLAFDAMAMGCILLASDVGATAELVSHGETGFLLPAEGIIKAMAAVLQRLAGDPAGRLAMAERAVAVTRARSWQNSVDPLAEWIERRHGPKAGVKAV
jgi:glycosyltransferase involved in cell wall biosynthesis